MDGHVRPVPLRPEADTGACPDKGVKPGAKGCDPWPFIRLRDTLVRSQLSILFRIRPLGWLSACPKPPLPPRGCSGAGAGLGPRGGPEVAMKEPPPAGIASPPPSAAGDDDAEAGRIVQGAGFEHLCTYGLDKRQAACCAWVFNIPGWQLVDTGSGRHVSFHEVRGRASWPGCVCDEGQRATTNDDG